MKNTVSTVIEHARHGDIQGVYLHYSRECDAEVRFSGFGALQHNAGSTPAAKFPLSIILPGAHAPGKRLR